MRAINDRPYGYDVSAADYTWISLRSACGRLIAAPTRGKKKLASAEAEASLETREILSGSPGRQQPGQREPITGEMIERLLQPTLLCAVSVGDLLFCPFFVFCRISGNILAAKRLYQRLYHVTVQGPFFGIILNILPDFIIIGLIADYMIIIGTLKYGFANFF